MSKNGQKKANQSIDMKIVHNTIKSIDSNRNCLKFQCKYIEIRNKSRKITIHSKIFKVTDRKKVSSEN